MNNRNMGAWIMMMLGIVGCGTASKPVANIGDADLNLYNSTARLEFQHDELTQAAASYRRALDRAAEMDDPSAIRTAAYNLAIVEASLADYDGTLALLDEAEYEARQTNTNMADIFLVQARVNLLKKDFAQAAKLANAVLDSPQFKPTNAQRLQARVLQGLAACGSQDAQGAALHLTEARKLLGNVPGPEGSAMVAGLSGELHLLTGDSAAAASDFDRQTNLARQARDYRMVDAALTKAGRAYVAAGNSGLAADRLYRAARAAISRGQPDAFALTNEAILAAASANDDAMLQLTMSLRSRAIAATQPTK